MIHSTIKLKNKLITQLAELPPELLASISGEEKKFIEERLPKEKFAPPFAVTRHFASLVQAASKKMIREM
jgi:hypothetical protein